MAESDCLAVVATGRAMFWETMGDPNAWTPGEARAARCALTVLTAIRCGIEGAHQADDFDPGPVPSGA